MMAHACDVVGYTYRADFYCPAHIAKAMARRGWPVCPGELDYADAAEDMLAELAERQGINREDEYSYDSDWFPKVVFRDQCEGGEQCGACGAELDK